MTREGTKRNGTWTFRGSCHAHVAWMEGKKRNPFETRMARNVGMGCERKKWRET